MKKISLRSAMVAALALSFAASASAGDMTLTIQNGRVTLVAQDVPVRQILQEWARIGQTHIVNGEKLFGPNVTLQLIDVPERDALDTLLRSASGYMAAPRAVALANASVYDRIMIMPTSRPPAALAQAPTPAQAPAFQRPPMPVDDDDEPVNVNVQPPPGMVNSPVIGSFPGAQPPFPGMQQQNVPVLTSPRPGALPVQQQPGQPYPMVPPNPSVVRPVGPGGPGGPGGGPGAF